MNSNDALLQCQTDLKSDVEIFADKAKETNFLHERIAELVSGVR